jgi:hypothetical protein
VCLLREELLALLADLALEVERTEEAERWGFALLRVPRTYGFRSAPLLLAGDVTTGFGRGSRDMGVRAAVDVLLSICGVVYGQCHSLE